MPRVSELFHSKWLKAEDLNNGQGGYRRVPVEIRSVVMEEVGGDRKAVVYFRGKEKGLVLNRTNADFLQEFCRSDDTDAWAGTRVDLAVERTKNPRGQTVPGLRVVAPRVDPPAFQRAARQPEPSRGYAPPRREAPPPAPAPPRRQPEPEQDFGGGDFDDQSNDERTDFDDDVPF